MKNTKERCATNAFCYPKSTSISSRPWYLPSSSRFTIDDPMSGGMEPDAVRSLAPVPVPSREGSECMADNPRLLQGGPLICSVSPLILVSTKSVTEVILGFRALVANATVGL